MPDDQRGAFGAFLWQLRGWISDDALEFYIKRSVVSLDFAGDWNVPLVIRDPD
jgi:hypothetical protein